MPRSTGVPLPPFQAVYDAHRDVVWRFVVSVVGRQDAEDVFQETWLAALRGYAALQHTDNLRAWVLTIAHRKGVDEHRARVRRPSPADSLPEPAASCAADCAAATGDQALWAHVRSLPPKQRAAVAYRFVGDLSYADIAAAMGISPAAARRNVHEAITKLRSTWAP